LSRRRDKLKVEFAIGDMYKSLESEKGGDFKKQSSTDLTTEKQEAQKEINKSREANLYLRRDKLLQKVTIKKPLKNRAYFRGFNIKEKRKLHYLYINNISSVIRKSPF